MTRLASALVCLLLCLGCATALDLERARGFVSRERAPEPPVLSESPPARIGAVEGLRTLSGELRLVPLRWDPLLAGDVGGYTVERATSEAGPFQRIAIVMGRFQTAFTDRGVDLGAKLGARETAGDLGDGNTYYYRVRPFDARGHLGAQLAPPQAGTTAPRPATPSGLRAYSQLPREVALSWEPASDPTVSGYVVWRSPSANGNFLAIARPNGRFTTTAVDRNLGDLRVFYYRVSAQNSAGGSSDQTPAARAVTKPEPLPPLGVQIAERALGRNVVAWQRNVESDLSGYRVFRRREGAPADELVAELSAETSSVADTAIGASERVSYVLLAFDRDGLESELSDPVESECVGYGLSAEVEGDTVTLRWDAAVQRELAAVRVLVDGSFGERELARADTPGFVHRDVPSGKTLRYRLVGVRPDGSEAPTSPVLEVKIPD
jgi:hypothetical protein